jgi:hypothetical protein
MTMFSNRAMLQQMVLRLQPKRGGKCCGVCCDYRRAVIILSLITLIAGIFVSILTTFFQRNFDVNAIEEEDLRKDIESFMEDAALPKTHALRVGSMVRVVPVVALVGAVTFNRGVVSLD